MKWTLLLSQSYPQPSATEFWVFLSCVLFVGGIIAGYWAYRANRKKAEESDEPKRRILPDPISIQQAKQYVSVGDFKDQCLRQEQEMKSMESRIEKKMEQQDHVLRARIHDLAGEVGAVSLKLDMREKDANEQYRKTEHSLGSLKSTIELTCAQAVRTEQRVAKMAEDFPDKIANAVSRRRA